MIERRNQSQSRVAGGEGIAGGLGRPRYSPSVGRSAVVPAVSGGFLTVLWRSRWIFLVCTVASLAGGFVYISAATPIYTATAKLYLDYANIPISHSYGGPGPVLRTDKYLHTQAERLRSRPVLAAAHTMLEDQPLRTWADVDVPVAFLRKNIVVKVGRKDETVSLSLESPYPLEAAQMVNTIVDAYMTSRSEDERQDATKVLNIWQSEMKLRRSALEKKRNELEQFQANDMPLTFGSEQGGGVMQSHLEYQSAYNQSQLATLRAKGYLDAVRDLSENPAALQQYLQAEGRTSEYVAYFQERIPLETKLTDFDLKREQLLETLTVDHPATAAATVEIDRIQEKLAALNDQFVDAVITAAQRQHVQAKANEQQQEALYKEQSERVRQSSKEIFQYQQLLSEVQWLQASVQTLDEEIEELRKIVGEDVGQMRMEILEPAQRPKVPSWPQKSKILAMALVLGLFLGGGIGHARVWLDQRLRSADEIAAALELPVLGVVPAMSRRHSLQTRGRKVSFQPDSAEAEAFRTIRTAVFFGAPKDKAKTLLVTSPAAADGKSTLVSNLAIAMATAGQKVLVLDADFRKPVQHLIFEVDHKERCISSVLGGKMRLAEAVQATPVDDLSLLACGHAVSNPAEVLNSHEFARILSELAGAYDRVLVDAPPVTVVTDAQILGAICDYAILVLKADKSTRRVARRAIEALDSVGAELLGTVVNEVKKGGGRYGYYGRYAASYRTGSNDGGAKKKEGVRADPGTCRVVTHVDARSEA